MSATLRAGFKHVSPGDLETLLVQYRLISVV
jgi:hypothetical protein